MREAVEPLRLCSPLQVEASIDDALDQGTLKSLYVRKWFLNQESRKRARKLAAASVE